MRHEDRAGVFFAEHFSMLIWPTGSRTWEAVDSLFPANSPKAILRFLIRTPVRQAEKSSDPRLPPHRVRRSSDASLSAPPHAHANDLPPQLLSPMPSSITPQSIGGTKLAQDAFKLINPQQSKALFLKLFGIDFESLKPRTDRPSDKQINFFIEYPPTHKEEYDLLVTVLHATSTKYYSSFQAGDWDNFARNMRAGVVLVRQIDKS